MTQNKNEQENDADKGHKIQTLRDMIENAERTMQSAKAMLLQLEGKKKVGRKRKIEDEGEGTVVEGTFDGQIMQGADNKQYPIPANYASKSKLVEGDMLKLTITPEGSFIYKQIGPIERRHIIGIMTQDEAGNYNLLADGKPYRVLLASVTYFKAEPGDEVAAVIPRDMESSWAAIENIIQKGKQQNWNSMPSSKFGADKEIEIWKQDLQEEKPPRKSIFDQSVIDEWASDIKEIEDEIKTDQQ